MRAHSWAETLKKEFDGVAVLDAIFGDKFIIVKATKAHQRAKVDRFFIKRDEVLIHIVDYKVDIRAAQTGNLAVEHISVQRNNETIAKGWVHVTPADLIIYYIPAWDKALVIKTNQIRERWDEIMRLWPPKATMTDRDIQNKLLNRPYKTLNCCIPVRWLMQNNFIIEEHEAIGVQLRLQLKT